MSFNHRRRIFLMRHGSVTYFDSTGKPFLPESVPLNEQGREQASAAGKVFAQAGINFDRVIVSGLPRTIETAQRVLAETSQAIDLQEWSDLVEIRGGRLSAIPDSELKEAFTGAFEGIAPEDKRFLGGESVGELMNRVHPAIDRLRADTEWDTVLLVLHGGVNRAILSYALTGERIFMGNLAQTAGCINAMDVGEQHSDWVVRVVNYSPMSSLQAESRGTTMEALFHQYRQARGL